MKTAVQWLSEQLLNLDVEFDSILINRASYWIKRNNIVEQAKEMEKQQIIDAMDICQRTDFYVKYECSEDYYNETFNK